jgi:REP element-mobilizing transposase RayT
MSTHEPLHPGHFYHIYNRGNNRETIFRTEENYRFFLRRFAHYVEPVAATYAYCLLPNHFHFLVYIRTAAEQRAWHQSCQLSESWQLLEAHRAFKNLFISYSMAFNRQTDRTGSLFQKRFKRKRVTDDRYFTVLVRYIHRNPQTHGLIADFRDWPWSSYGAVLSDRPSRVQRAEVLAWFDGPAEFEDAHRAAPDEKIIAPFAEDDR